MSVLVLVALALLGVPLFVVIAAAALFIYWSAELNPSLAVMEFVRFAEYPEIAAVPMLAFCGVLILRSRLVERFQELQRSIAGSIAVAGAVTSLLMFVLAGTLTGVSVLVVTAITAVVVRRHGEVSDGNRADLRLIMTGLSVGALIAPSATLLLFAVAASQLAPGYAISPLKLYLAALLPAMLMLVVLGSMSIRPYWSFDRSATAAPHGQAVPAGVGLELPLPFVMIGAIYSGWLDILEAGLLATIWLTIALVFIRGEVPPSKLPGIIADSIVWSAAVVLIFALSIVAAAAMSDTGMPQNLQSVLPPASAGVMYFWLALIISLLLIGMLLETTAAIALTGPLLVPLALAVGIHPAHLGVVAVMALLGGQMVTSDTGEQGVSTNTRGGRSALPRVAIAYPYIYFLMLAIVTIWPGLALWGQS